MSKVKRKSASKKSSPLPRLKFEWGGKPLSGADINYWSWQLNLPEDYQRLLRKSNGGSPDKADFRWEHPDEGMQDSHLDKFLGIDNRPFGPERDVDCVSTIIRNRDYLPRFAIPIALVDRDDLLLTFWSGERKDQVWLLRAPYYPAEVTPEESTYFVANSLVEFLNSLTKPDDAYSPITLALDSPKVRGKQLDVLLKRLGCRVFKYQGVQSSAALPPAWEWPRYRRAESDSPAFISMEKNHTYGHAPKCDDRAKGHKMLRVDVTKSQRKQCLKELLDTFGGQVEVVDA